MHRSAPHNPIAVPTTPGSAMRESVCAPRTSSILLAVTVAPPPPPPPTTAGAEGPPPRPPAPPLRAGARQCPGQQNQRRETGEHHYRFTVTEKPLLLPSGS